MAKFYLQKTNNFCPKKQERQNEIRNPKSGILEAIF